MKKGQRVKIITIDSKLANQGVKLGDRGVIKDGASIFGKQVLVRMDLTGKELWIKKKRLRKTNLARQTIVGQRKAKRSEPEIPIHHFRGYEYYGLRETGTEGIASIGPMERDGKIVFNGPATIIFFKDLYGEHRKAVAKCAPGEDFDPRIGVSIAILRMFQVLIEQKIKLIGDGKPGNVTMRGL